MIRRTVAVTLVFATLAGARAANDVPSAGAAREALAASASGPPASNSAARAAALRPGVPTAAQIDAVAIPAVDALIQQQYPDGTFDDPIRGQLAKGGLTRVVFAALSQAARLGGDAALARVKLARRSLARGTEGTQLLPKWSLALIAETNLQQLLPHPDAIPAELSELGKLHASGVADQCYQRKLCFNNYHLTSQVLNLELVHAGITGNGPGVRLSDPHLRLNTLRWLGANLPATTSETASVFAPGAGRHAAAALSDPTSYPLAYQAFCTAMLTRAAVLGGSQLPGAAWRLERAALWELVGMTAPNGEISWMGRGQDELWTLAAALYAGVQGSTLMARTDPALAARLRRLARVELAALQSRLGPTGLRPKPNDDLTPSGLDDYASAIGTESLALVWLELARAALPAAIGPAVALPAERNASWSSDPRGNGLLTLRDGHVWIGVHRVEASDDPRLGWGLMRAMRKLRDGTWASLLPERPLGPPGPAAGPVLVRGRSSSDPQTSSSGVSHGAIVLAGAWSGYAGTVPGRWQWTPLESSVELTSTCPRGASLRFTEWLPRNGRLHRGRSAISRAGFRVSFSRPISVRKLSGSYGSAREPHMAAYRVSVHCAGQELNVFWSGGERALG
ncbi:MAG TPA: hypothetical protein VLJ42_00765 [Solirubrobacteraceae bacterium]|nr:hypothetical protein [Solirubrobacteraceae bacterium]